MYVVLVKGDRKMLQYIMPSIKHRRVLKESDLRVEMAKKQLNRFQEQKAKNKIQSKKEIIELVNTFLEQIGIGINSKFDNEVKLKSKKETSKGRISYFDIKQQSGISCKEDIVWIKLNKCGCISVVGVGCDIYFTHKTKTTTSSGKINTYLKQEWDEEFVLVFPLIGLEQTSFDRSDVESGVGNYLIANGVPVLDYYSHNY